LPIHEPGHVAGCAAARCGCCRTRYAALTFISSSHPVLRDKQKATLSVSCTASRCMTSIDTCPTVPAIIFANEDFTCCRSTRWVNRYTGPPPHLAERVSKSNGNGTLCSGAATDPILRFEPCCRHWCGGSPARRRFEWATPMRKIMKYRDARSRIRRRAAAHRLWVPPCWAATHRRIPVSGPMRHTATVITRGAALKNPGSSSITAHVDFQAWCCRRGFCRPRPWPVPQGRVSSSGSASNPPRNPPPLMAKTTPRCPRLSIALQLPDRRLASAHWDRCSMVLAINRTQPHRALLGLSDQERKHQAETP